MQRFTVLRALGALALVLVVAMAAGCGKFTSTPGTGIDPIELYAGDAGLACALIGLQAPDQVANAKIASAAARAILVSDAPSLSAIEAAVAAAGVPPQYRAITVVVIARVKVRLAGADVLPKDSVGFRAVQAFVESCDAALV